MSPGQEFAHQMSQAARLESRLADALTDTAEEVARTECFDSEQRAEVYAILDTLRADSQAHRECVGRWVNDRTGEAHDV